MNRVRLTAFVLLVLLVVPLAAPLVPRIAATEGVESELEPLPPPSTQPHAPKIRLPPTPPLSKHETPLSALSKLWNNHVSRETNGSLDLLKLRDQVGEEIALYKREHLPERIEDTPLANTEYPLTKYTKGALLAPPANTDLATRERGFSHPASVSYTHLTLPTTERV